jgi:hypothetical protein
MTTTNPAFDKILEDIANRHTAIASQAAMMAGSYQALVTLIRAGVSIPAGVMGQVMGAPTATVIEVPAPAPVLETAATVNRGIPKSARTPSARVTQPVEPKPSVRKSARKSVKPAEPFALKEHAEVYVTDPNYTGPAQWSRGWRGTGGVESAIVTPRGDRIRVLTANVHPPDHPRKESPKADPTAPAASTADQPTMTSTAVTDTPPATEAAPAVPDLTVLHGADTELDKLATERGKDVVVPAPTPQDVPAKASVKSSVGKLKKAPTLPADKEATKSKVLDTILSLNPSEANPIAAKAISEKSGVQMMDVLTAIMALNEGNLVKVNRSALVIGARAPEAAAVVSEILEGAPAEARDW